jgi:WhiB family redox-sensing transcriptional regulator
MSGGESRTPDLSTRRPSISPPSTVADSTPLDRFGRWMQLALCANHPDKEAWFSDYREQSKQAIAVCRRCPVRCECLAHALAAGEPMGIWGGLRATERQALMVGANKRTVAARGVG